MGICAEVVWTNADAGSDGNPLLLGLREPERVRFSVEDIVVQADRARVTEQKEEVLEGLCHPEALSKRLMKDVAADKIRLLTSMESVIGGVSAEMSSKAALPRSVSVTLMIEVHMSQPAACHDCSPVIRYMMKTLSIASGRRI